VRRLRFLADKFNFTNIKGTAHGAVCDFGVFQIVECDSGVHSEIFFKSI
jgi:hypothetical protein